ncbi:MAG: hypothetical protein IH614_14400 [Desulfuromonadales bacterium]|nr:hypothetical protein [Desulfuromonadales bacterium]
MVNSSDLRQYGKFPRRHAKRSVRHFLAYFFWGVAKEVRRGAGAQRPAVFDLGLKTQNLNAVYPFEFVIEITPAFG